MLSQRSTSSGSRVAPGEGQPALRGPAPFVGRTTELAVLEAALDSASGGRTQAVLVDGEAGIGKSRLIEEFCDRARLREATVAVGCTVPYGSSLPYVPIAGILRSLSLVTPLANPLLRVATGETTGDSDEESDLIAAATQRRDFHAQTAFAAATLRLVATLAETAPVALVLEDLQWSDLASASLLDYLLRNLGDSRVLIVCSVRSEEVPAGHLLREWLSELIRFARTTRLTVTGLERAHVTGLLKSSAGGPVAVDRVESILERAQGNPFYAEELLAVGSTSELPASLHDVLMARIRQRSVDCRRVLSAAAVGGLTIRDDVLAAVSECASETFIEAIGEALDHRLVQLTPDGTSYQLRHALLREAIYGSLTPAERRGLHQRFADALTALPAVDSGSSQAVAEIANHRWSAGEWAATIDPSLRAAEAAMRSFAFREAETHFGHALDAIRLLGGDGGLSAAQRLRVLEKAAESSYFGASHERAAEMARAAIDEALRLGDLLAAARSYVLLGRACWGTGTSSGAQDALIAAKAVLPPEPSIELAYVLAEEARFEMLMSRDHQAQALAREAIAMAQRLGARDAEGNAKNTLACTIANDGDAEPALSLLREALDIAEELQLPEDLNRAYTNLTYVLAEAGRLEETALIALDALAVGEELGGIRLNGACSNSIAALDRLGRWDEAESLADDVGNAPYGYCAAALYTNPLPFAIRRGRFDQAADLLASAHDISDGLGDVMTSGGLNNLHAEYELMLGHPEVALTYARRASELAAQADMASYTVEFGATLLRALADLSAGNQDRQARIDEAERVMKQARAAAVESDPVGRRDAFLALCEAELTRCERSSGDAWAVAGTAFDAAPDAYHRAYCSYREAEALVESGASRSSSRDRILDALSRSRALGTTPLTNAIQDLATRARFDLPAEVAPQRQDDPAKELGLTAREVEVLGHLAIGATDREIAEDLFISKKTVSVHVSNVLRKLEVPSRVEAGRIGQLHGLAPALT